MRGKKWLAVLLAVLLVAFRPALAQAGEIIRVGLGAELARAEVEIYSGTYEIVDLATGATLGEANRGSRWVLAPAAAGVEIAAGEGGSPFALGSVLFRRRGEQGQTPVFVLNGRRYRGDLRLDKGKSGGLVAVNLLDVEEYLYGVVGEEMGYRAPVEALKAQAVASRTYALYRRASQSSALYDVGTDQATQVYAGFEAETKPGFERVKEAVDATRGEVIYYQGKLIEAYFHANAGGHTEYSENVWQLALPYLRGVPSPWDEYALRYQPQDARGWPAYTYRWEKVMTRNELAQRIAAWNAARQGQPEQGIDVGEVLELLPSRLDKSGNPTVSGRITTLVIKGRAGQKELRGEAARSLLGLRSTLFEVVPDSQVFLLGAGAKPEARQEAETLMALAGQSPVAVNAGAPTYWVLGADGVKRQLPKIFTRLEFRGRGYGHGVGMSQWGAQGMAVEGHSYREILEYYYNQNKRDGRLKIAPYQGSGG